MTSPTRRWQLVHDGKIVAEHPTKLACAVEAFERKLVWRSLRTGPFLTPSASIRPTSPEPITGER